MPGLIAATLAIVLAWPLVRMYSSAGLEERSKTELALYSADVRDYLQPHPRSAFWGAGAEPWVERALFPGLMAIALTLVGLTRRLGRLRVVYLVGLLVAFEMSRGSNGEIYRYLYEWLGFMRGIRAPARAGFLFGLALAVLSGFGVQRLLAGRSRAASFTIVAILTIAIGVDLRPALQLESGLAFCSAHVSIDQADRRARGVPDGIAHQRHGPGHGYAVHVLLHLAWRAIDQRVQRTSSA